MAQGNGPSQRPVGYPPQQAAPGDQQQGVDPRYTHQQGQQGQPVAPGHNPGAQYGEQDPYTQPPAAGYQPPQQHSSYGAANQTQQPPQPVAAPPEYGAQNQMPQGDNQFGGAPAPADPNGYAPQFGAYAPQGGTQPAGDPGGQQYGQQVAPTGAPPAAPGPQFDEAQMTGDAAYQQQQNYPNGAPGQTMENPAFPNHQQGQVYAQPDPVTGGVAPGQPDAGLYGAPQQDTWGQTAPAAVDQQGYETGGYAGAQPGQGMDQGQPDYLAQPDYGNQANAQQFGADPAQGYGDPALVADPFAGHPGGAYPDDQQVVTGAPAEGAGGDYDTGYEDDDYGEHYEAEAAAGGTSRTLMIVGALVGAIVMGGGLAYGWKIISGPGAGGKSGATPVVVGRAGPSKTRPAEPGGKRFDHADSKIMDRLGGSGAGRARTDANGTRQVPTVSVTRNGQIAAPANAPQVPPSTGNAPTISVPGLTVVDAFGNSGAGPNQGGATARSPSARKPPPPSARKPIVLTPPTTGSTQAPAKARVQIRNAPKKPIVITKKTVAPVVKKTKPVVRKKVTAPAKTAAPSSGGRGFVVVLASVPVSSSSRMNALMKYADLQQKYNSVLGSKTPDVREANLGEKGKYHRLLVGPPGSRAAASGLCSKLKTAGYSGCWVTSY